MYDAVFISYNEPDADERYKRLLERYPNTKSLHGVKGIHQAHIEAAKKCYTKMFWVIDGDADLLPEFNLDHKVNEYDLDCVHVWRSRNPINDLVYGYGGVKLFPTAPLKNATDWNIDFTTSVGGSNKFRPMPAVSNTTRFNTDPFNTWKSAFRECTKLASAIIPNHDNTDNLYRLKVWQERGEKRDYGKYAIMGAKQGAEFGEHYKNDIDILNRINDFKWLKDTYEQQAT